MLEVEVKIPAVIDDIEKQLQVLGYERGTTVYEYDTYYNGIQMDLRATDRALRIREHKDVDSGEVKYVLNYKGKKIDEVTLAREETQFVIPSMAHGDTLLRGLGFLPAGFVEKTRIHYKKEEVTCCLDRVSDLGDFLEIEIMAPDDAAYRSAMNRIQELMEALSLHMKDTVRSSYLSMLEEK